MNYKDLVVDSVSAFEPGAIRALKKREQRK